VQGALKENQWQDVDARSVRGTNTSVEMALRKFISCW
jgi:hypothetical protein